MNKESIKERAPERGYTLASESETSLVFTKGNVTITVTDNLITTNIAGKKAFNFVTTENVDVVSKSILR